MKKLQRAWNKMIQKHQNFIYNQRSIKKVTQVAQ